jgi:two-component system, LytTR family, response regulator
METGQNKLHVPTSRGHYFFDTNEILRLEASSNYTFIYLTGNRRLLTARVLKSFAQALEPHGFIRTHRTHLVNRQYIATVSREGIIRLKDDSVATISRQQKSKVMKKLCAA